MLIQNVKPYYFNNTAIQNNTAAKMENGHIRQSAGNSQLMSYPAEYYISFGKSDGISQEEKEEIADMFRTGETPADIAMLTGKSIADVQKVLQHWRRQDFGSLEYKNGCTSKGVILDIPPEKINEAVKNGTSLGSTINDSIYDENLNRPGIIIERTKPQETHIESDVKSNPLDISDEELLNAARLKYPQESYFSILEKLDELRIEMFKNMLGKPIEEASSEELLKTAGIECSKDANDNLLTISEYRSPSKYLSWKMLGADENRLLKNIKKIKGNADFRWSKAVDLGELKEIGGNADFYNSEIANLGELKEIGGNANFYRTSWKLRSLGKLEKIGGSVNFDNTYIQSIYSLKKVGGTCYISGSNIASETCLRKGFSYTYERCPFAFPED